MLNSFQQYHHIHMYIVPGVLHVVWVGEVGFESFYNVASVLCTYTGCISENLTREGKLHIREILGGGNMKTRVAVYEDGLLDLKGGKTF